MKRTRQTLALLLALGLLGGLFAIPEHAHAEHVHTYNGPWIQDWDATCTQPGQRHTVCDAGDYTLYDAYPPALGHDWGIWTLHIPAGCTTTGTNMRTCKRCGDVQYQTTAALGHNFGEWKVVTQPWCTTTGLSQRVCSRCGTAESNTLPALGHQWGPYVEVRAAACDVPGLKESTCARCGQKQAQVIPALLHNWGAYVEVTAPSCTLPGLKERTCSLCLRKQAQVTPALGHSWGAYVTTVVPTCTATGWVERVCARCGQKSGYPLAKVPHQWGPWTVTAAPACGVKGQEARTCAVCARQELRTIKALKHVSDNNWVIVRAATLGARGLQATHCTLCGKQVSTRTYAPRGYTYDVRTHAYGAPLNQVSPAHPNDPGYVVLVDLTQDGALRVPLVTEDGWRIGEAVLTVANRMLRVSLKELSEPTRFNDARWALIPLPVDPALTLFPGGASQPFDRDVPTQGDRALVYIDLIANYYQGNENRRFTPLDAAPQGGTWVDWGAQMLQQIQAQ